MRKGDDYRQSHELYIVQNNGTATFGDSYAEKLTEGRLYHTVINYEVEADGSKRSSESPIFRMINPLPVRTSTRPSASTPGTTSSQTSSPSQSPSSTPSTSLSTSPSSSSTTSNSAINSASTPSSTTSATASPSQTPSPSPTPTPTPQTGLTPGSKVGITVGVLALVIIIFLAAFFFHRKRQAKKKAQAEQQHDQQANRNTVINLEDIDITLGSPVTYSRVYEGRRGWHQRDLPPIVVPGTATGRVQSQQELYGSPF